MTAPDPYTTPDDLRTAWPVLDDADRFSDELLAELVAECERVFERARGVFYRRREVTEVRRARQVGRLQLANPVDVEVSAVSVNGTALDVDGLAALDEVGVDLVLAGGSWAPGDLVSVTYTSGFSELPAGGVLRCGEYVRAKALEATSNAPRMSLYEQGADGTPLRLSTASWPDDRFTGIITVDDWLRAQPDYRVPGVG